MSDRPCGCPDDPQLPPLERTVTPAESRSQRAERELMERGSSGGVDEGPETEVDEG